MSEPLSGGCQCGAVRYRIKGSLEYPHLCHCRMCQKASGNYFLPLAFAPGDGLQVTRGEPTWFASSDPVRRGFCVQCGTPLFFDTRQSDGVAVTLGSLDDPSLVPPIKMMDRKRCSPFFISLPICQAKTLTEMICPAASPP